MLKNVLVQGAPVGIPGRLTTEHFEFTSNAPGAELPGDFDLLVDVHRVSAMSPYFSKERRLFATNESPLYVPYFSDLSGIEYVRNEYAAVLTNDVFILGWPNARYANLHYKWVTARTEIGKKFGISAMFSAKGGLPNYELRHKILENTDKIKIPQMVVGQSSRQKMFPLQCVWEHASKDATFDYMFHFAIENCCSPGYFTEKLIDCMCTYTVPLLLGPHDIGRYFNADGIIMLDPEHWLEQVNSLTPEDYTLRLPAMEENFKRSMRYWDFFTALDAALTDHGYHG